jgi:hypothetical protein
VSRSSALTTSTEQLWLGFWGFGRSVLPIPVNPGALGRGLGRWCSCCGVLQQLCGRVLLPALCGRIDWLLGGVLQSAAAGTAGADELLPCMQYSCCVWVRG